MDQTEYIIGEMAATMSQLEVHVRILRRHRPKLARAFVHDLRIWLRRWAEAMEAGE